jgi:hypothetical protein
MWGLFGRGHLPHETDGHGTPTKRLSTLPSRPCPLDWGLDGEVGVEKMIGFSLPIPFVYPQQF